MAASLDIYASVAMILDEFTACTPKAIEHF